MIKRLFLIGSLACSNFIFGQSCLHSSLKAWQWPSQSNWFFGNDILANFSDTINDPTFEYFGDDISEFNNRFYEGSVTISDDSGALVAYSNGIQLKDKDQNIIASDLLSGNENGASPASSSSQGVLAVKHPNNPDNIYIFTTDDVLTGEANGLNYYILNLTDMTLSDPVLLQNEIGEKFRTTEQIEATFHANGSDIWVITRESGQDDRDNYGNFYSYLLTCKGIDPNPVKSTFTIPQPNFAVYSWDKNYERGALKISWNGKLAATANHVNAFGANHIAITIHDFNNSTGLLTNSKLCSGILGDWNYVGKAYNSCYDLEWAPNSKGLYVSTFRDGLLWLDGSLTTKEDIHASIKVIDPYSKMSDLKLGRNNKLYQTTDEQSIIEWEFSSLYNLNYGIDANLKEITLENRSRLGLGNMFIPPANYINEHYKETIVCSGDDINLSSDLLCLDTTNWGASGAPKWSSDCGDCLLDPIYGKIDPSKAKSGYNTFSLTIDPTCPSKTDIELEFECASGLAETQLNNSILVYPNPIAGSQINFSGNLQSFHSADIFSSSGQLIIQGIKVQHGPNNSHFVNLNLELDKGFYLVVFSSDTTKNRITTTITK